MEKEISRVIIPRRSSATTTTQSTGQNLMSQRKLEMRLSFRTLTFKRDGFKCRACGIHEMNLPINGSLDAHHITDRKEMPNGGYVKENGITLCPKCHLEAEQYHISGGTTWVSGRSPDDLYRLIGSSKEKAIAASNKL